MLLVIQTCNLGFLGFGPNVHTLSKYLYSFLHCSLDKTSHLFTLLCYFSSLSYAVPEGLALLYLCPFTKKLFKPPALLVILLFLFVSSYHLTSLQAETSLGLLHNFTQPCLLGFLVSEVTGSPWLKAGANRTFLWWEPPHHITSFFISAPPREAQSTGFHSCGSKYQLPSQLRLLELDPPPSPQ